jgi:hypothetical protein
MVEWRLHKGVSPAPSCSQEKGLTVRAIADELTGRGYKTRVGTAFNSGQVSRILQRSLQ